MSEPVNLDALERVATRAKADGDWLSEGTPDPDAVLALIQRVRLLEKKACDWNAEADKYLAERDTRDVEIGRLTERVGEAEAGRVRACDMAADYLSRAEAAEQRVRDLEAKVEFLSDERNMEPR